MASVYNNNLGGGDTAPTSGWAVTYPPGDYDHPQFVGRGAMNDQTSAIIVQDPPPPPVSPRFAGAVVDHAGVVLGIPYSAELHKCVRLTTGLALGASFLGVAFLTGF